MNLDINAIFREKLAEIERRLASSAPGIISNKTDAVSDIPFEQYLSDASLINLTEDSTSLLGMDELANILSKQDDDSYSNILKAQINLARSTAYIPSDKSQLMTLINAGIEEASQKYGIDKDLIRAVMKQESSFNPTAISKSGAQGLMQLMPNTADILSVKNPFDIIQNINGGTQYLRDQLSRFSGDLSLALAAYNAGPNSVDQYGGIPPYTETKEYVQKVTEYYNQYKQLTGR